MLSQQSRFTFSDYFALYDIIVGFFIKQEKQKLLKETLEDIADHYTLSQDTDARIGHKSKPD